MEHQVLHRQAGKDTPHIIRHPLHFYPLCRQKDQVEVLELNLQPGLQRFIAQRTGATAEEVSARYVPMVSSLMLMKHCVQHSELTIELSDRKLMEVVRTVQS